jgi:hypothetical protein
MVLVPETSWHRYYASNAPSPKAALALINTLEDFLDISIPLSDLPEAADAWEKDVNDLAAEDNEVAEYVRDGTIWSKVNANIEYYGQFKLNNPHTFFLNSNTVLTAYTVLTMDKTVEYLCNLQRKYKFHMTMSVADLFYQPNALTGEARIKAIASLTRALEILEAPDINGDGIKAQISSVKYILENSEPDEISAGQFFHFTKEIDTLRNQSFENVFGLKLSNTQNS